MRMRFDLGGGKSLIRRGLFWVLMAPFLTVGGIVTALEAPLFLPVPLIMLIFTYCLIHMHVTFAPTGIVLHTFGPERIAYDRIKEIFVAHGGAVMADRRLPPHTRLDDLMRKADLPDVILHLEDGPMIRLSVEEPEEFVAVAKFHLAVHQSGQDRAGSE